jgi:hypothetical protein
MSGRFDLAILETGHYSKEHHSFKSVLAPCVTAVEVSLEEGIWIIQQGRIYLRIPIDIDTRTHMTHPEYVSSERSILCPELERFSLECRSNSGNIFEEELYLESLEVHIRCKNWASFKNTWMQTSMTQAIAANYLLTVVDFV